MGMIWKRQAYQKGLEKGKRLGAKQELENLIDINNMAWLDSHHALKSDLESRSCYAGYSDFLNEVLKKRLKELG